MAIRRVIVLQIAKLFDHLCFVWHPSEVIAFGQISFCKLSTRKQISSVARTSGLKEFSQRVRVAKPTVQHKYAAGDAAGLYVRPEMDPSPLFSPLPSLARRASGGDEPGGIPAQSSLSSLSKILENICSNVLTVTRESAYKLNIRAD